MLWLDGKRFRVAKIGDPDEYLSFGTHVFEIRYTVPGVLDPGSTGADKKFAESTGDASSSPSVFFWNVIAPSWNNRMQQADISVTLPGDVTGAQCSVGYGVGSPCRGLTVTGNKVELSASYLGSRTPVTVRAGVDVPTPARDGTAVALHLGSDPRPVVERHGVDPESDGGGRARRFPLVPHHGRAVARIPAAIRAAAGPWAGADRIHPHRESFRRMPSPRRFSIWPNARMIELKQINDEHWRIRGLADMSEWERLDPVSRKVGIALKVNRPRRRVRGEEDRQVRREAEQGQDRYRQGRRRSGPSTAA